jgi:uncharacterized protein
MTKDKSVLFYKNDDQVLAQASLQARATFKYFWNQVALDFNRIIPALELACLKVLFLDDFSDPKSPVEHMWVDQIYFDGIEISGRLMNSPNQLNSVSIGDKVRFPLERISDWLCVIEGKVYGAHTIQIMRSRMEENAREKHDQVWGLSFPSPEKVLIPERNQEFEKVIANLIIEQIEEEPATLTANFGNGCTLLHLESLYDRSLSVEVLLKKGADPTTLCERGWSALDYAKSLKWEDAINLLKQ